MGEGAAAVAVAERPDAGDAGAELVVYCDESACVEGHAGLFKAEVVGVGSAADGEEDVGADALRWVVGAIDACGDVVAAWFEVDALSA